ncbi:MAG: hypothetical protein J6Z08_01660 [Elusimicrobiales bacterium]|jgi:hypothetical protein|nr:hypothetical protein [Elusimicrobiales bacterium]
MEYINKVETEAEMLDRLISDYGPHKYNDLVRAMQWARHLRHLEENREIPLSELIEKAMLAIARQEVGPDEIIKAMEADAVMDRKLAQRRSERARQQEAPVSEEEIKKFSSEDDK